MAKKIRSGLSKLLKQVKKLYKCKSCGRVFRFIRRKKDCPSCFEKLERIK